MQCIDCRGAGKIGPVHINKGSNEQRGRCEGMWVESMDCLRCNGTGDMPEEMAKWIDDGLARRVARVKSGETLWSAAKRMGIPVHELSAMERGSKPFVN